MSSNRLEVNKLKDFQRVERVYSVPKNETNQVKPKAKPVLEKSIEDGIGIRLKAARENKGISQTDLHRLTGLSRTVLINYEAGRHIPGVRELRLLSDALGVTPNWLIYGTEEPIPKSDGLVDTILSMGASGLLPLMTMVSLLPAILGKDDTRIILVLVESLLKAKSPEGYADIMGVVRTMKSLSENPTLKDPKKMDELFEDYPESLNKLQAYREKLNKIQEKAKKL